MLGHGERSRSPGRCRHLLAALAVSLLAVPAAHADKRDAGARSKKAKKDVPRALHEPIRLTAGSSNQWMGVLHPDGDALYFVSDRNATAEIFMQQPVNAGPRLLFDSNADVTWPRPSPDGKRLAFISYRADAAGDLCLRDADGDDERCLTGLESAEVQPLWLSDDGDSSDTVAVLMRNAMHDNYQLRRFGVGDSRGAQGDNVLERNMLGVAASPDGRWLAYVPLERTRRDIGISFANKSGRGLVLQPVGGDESGAITLTPELPGMTGFPAFSRDGRFLYFVQYLNDTNGDGAIDGNDNSVLFRLPFDPGKPSAVTLSFPQQLTSARWNCRYPSPARDRLIMTCSHLGSLDIFSVPLTGAVPQEWSPARIRSELHVARNHWTKLLLLTRLLGQISNPSERVAVLRQMIWLHVELREYESAAYHSQQLLAAAGQQGGSDAARSEATRAWAEVMRDLIEHRKEDVRLTHGQLSDRYLRTESQRSRKLETLGQTMSGPAQRDVAALAALVRSEIADDIGAKDSAEALFAAIDHKAIEDPLVLDVYAQRARAIHTLRGDRQGLVTLYGDLAGHAALDTIDRLRFAEEFVATLVRGVPTSQRIARVNAWVKRLEAQQPDSELALMVRVAGWLLQLDDATQEDVRAGIFELYKSNTDTDRRRALVLSTVRTASRLGNEYLQYQFATSWASWLRRSEPERKYAEVLYRQVVLERAYNELASGAAAKARASFYAGTVQTLSLEAHIGFIEARLLEGKNDVRESYDKRFAKKPDDPSYAFVKAYLDARELPRLTGDKDFAQAAQRALSELESAAAVWPRSMEIHHVWATVLHQRALRSGSKDDAIDAHSHYLLALDLARDNPRFKAAILHQVGLLQAELGNHRIALGHFAERDRLPHVSPARELNFRLARARSHFHARDEKSAVGQASRALDLIAGQRALGRYRPLAVDRLALYHQAAGHFDQALARYQELIAIVDEAANSADDDGVGLPINRVKARLGAASAALGAGKYDAVIAQVAALDEILASGGELRPKKTGPTLAPGSSARMGKRDTRILAWGLAAQAHRGSGDYARAAEAMETRRALLAARARDSEADGDLLELARTRYHLAEYAFHTGDHDLARRHIERGLERSAEFNRRTGSGVNDVGLRLLQSYAELHLYGGLKLASYTLDLRKELHVAYEFICKNPSPTWQADRFLFALYLTMLDVAA